MIEIIEAKSKRQLNAFAKFPTKLYKNNQFYVPSFLDDDRKMKNIKVNHAAEGCLVKCFLAYKNKKIVGRIAGIILPANRGEFNIKKVRFSRIDFIEDIEVLQALLNAVIEFGKENGCEYIHGPWGFNDTDREGMLTKGFDQVSTYATAYSYPYYHRMIESLGFEKQSEWIEHDFSISNKEVKHPRVLKKIKECGFRDIAEICSLKTIIKDYGDKFFDCYNRAYAQLDGFFPIEGEVKKNVLSQFASIINPDFFSLIEDTKNGKIVAFGVGIPNISSVLIKSRGSMIRSIPGLLKTIKHPKDIELALIAVDPDYQMSGAHVLVIERFKESYFKHKIGKFSIDPILTSNLSMLNTWKHFNVTETKRRQTYIKKI